MHASTQIDYHADDSEETRLQLEGQCEGTVRQNMVWLERHPIEDREYTYEDPRIAGRKQRVGTAAEVHRRGKATCVEWACARAAANRLAGINCWVKLVPKLDVKGVPIDYEYHAILQYPDGQTEDVTRELRGYAPSVGHGGAWWEEAGHCCASCALDKPCEGTCDHHHEHHHDDHPGPHAGGGPGPHPESPGSNPCTKDWPPAPSMLFQLGNGQNLFVRRYRVSQTDVQLQTPGPKHPSIPVCEEQTAPATPQAEPSPSTARVGRGPGRFKSGRGWRRRI